MELGKRPRPDEAQSQDPAQALAELSSQYLILKRHHLTRWMSSPHFETLIFGRLVRVSVQGEYRLLQIVGLQNEIAEGTHKSVHVPVEPTLQSLSGVVVATGDEISAKVHPDRSVTMRGNVKGTKLRLVDYTTVKEEVMDISFVSRSPATPEEVKKLFSVASQDDIIGKLGRLFSSNTPPPPTGVVALSTTLPCWADVIRAHEAGLSSAVLPLSGNGYPLLSATTDSARNSRMWGEGVKFRELYAGTPFEDGVVLAIIVPYRNQREQNRELQLNEFVKRLPEYLSSLQINPPLRDYHVFIMNQSEDGTKFNRGKTLNAGFLVSTEMELRAKIGIPDSFPRFNAFCFHDVDLIPGAILGPWYGYPPILKPIHVGAAWTRYPYETYVGGIITLSQEQMEKCNGFPNDFWGWGGEDDELGLRLKASNFLPVIRPEPGIALLPGVITDLEDLLIKEKGGKRAGIGTEFKNMLKYENIARHEETWRENGINALVADFKSNMNKLWSIVGVESLGPKVFKVTVDLKPENDPFAREAAEAERKRLAEQKDAGVDEEMEQKKKKRLETKITAGPSSKVSVPNLENHRVWIILRSWACQDVIHADIWQKTDTSLGEKDSPTTPVALGSVTLGESAIPEMLRTSFSPIGEAIDEHGLGFGPMLVKERVIGRYHYLMANVRCSMLAPSDDPSASPDNTASTNATPCLVPLSMAASAKDYSLPQLTLLRTLHHFVDEQITLPDVLPAVLAHIDVDYGHANRNDPSLSTPLENVRNSPTPNSPAGSSTLLSPSFHRVSTLGGALQVFVVDADTLGRNLLKRLYPNHPLHTPVTAKVPIDGIDSSIPTQYQEHRRMSLLRRWLQKIGVSRNPSAELDESLNDKTFPGEASFITTEILDPSGSRMLKLVPNPCPVPHVPVSWLSWVPEETFYSLQGAGDLEPIPNIPPPQTITQILHSYVTGVLKRYSGPLQLEFPAESLQSLFGSTLLPDGQTLSDRVFAIAAPEGRSPPSRRAAVAYRAALLDLVAKFENQISQGSNLGFHEQKRKLQHIEHLKKQADKALAPPNPNPVLQATSFRYMLPAIRVQGSEKIWVRCLFPRRNANFLRCVMFHGTAPTAARLFMDKKGISRALCRVRETCKEGNCNDQMLGFGVYFGGHAKAKVFCQRRSEFCSERQQSVGSIVAFQVQLGHMQERGLDIPCACGCGTAISDHLGRWFVREGYCSLYVTSATAATKDPEWAISDPRRAVPLGIEYVAI